jgi:hypothetical protein
MIQIKIRSQSMKINQKNFETQITDIDYFLENIVYLTLESSKSEMAKFKIYDFLKNHALNCTNPEW